MKTRTTIQAEMYYISCRYQCLISLPSVF